MIVNYYGGESLSQDFSSKVQNLGHHYEIREEHGLFGGAPWGRLRNATGELVWFRNYYERLRGDAPTPDVPPSLADDAPGLRRLVLRNSAWKHEGVNNGS